MIDNWMFFTLVLAIPFVCLTIMFVVLVLANTKTTGEIKYILPPDILLKIFAVFLLVIIIFILALSKILTESTVSALLGAIGSGAIGMSLSSKNTDSKK